MKRDGFAYGAGDGFAYSPAKDQKARIEIPSPERLRQLEKRAQGMRADGAAVIGVTVNDVLGLVKACMAIWEIRGVGMDAMLRTTEPGDAVERILSIARAAAISTAHDEGIEK